MPLFFRQSLFSNYFPIKSSNYIARNYLSIIHKQKLVFDQYDTLENEAKIEKTNPLIIVHGLFGHKQNWRTVGKAIQKKLDNYVFVVDLINHGESPHTPEFTYTTMADDIHGFIQDEVFQKSRFKTVFLLGHSMGGKVVTEFALDKTKTNLIEKLIVEEVAPHRGVAKSSNSTPFHAYIQALKRVDLNLPRNEIDRALKKDIKDDATRAFLLTNLYKPRGGPFHWHCNLDALYANLNHILEYKVDVNKKAECQTLFISGEKSNYMPDADRPLLKKMFPYAEFVKIPNAGHWIHAERPEQFVKTVVDFLQSGYITYES